MKSLKLATPSPTMESMSSRPASPRSVTIMCKAVIDGGLLIGFFPPGIEGVAHARAFGLNGEIDERGGAAEGGGFSAGFEIVGRSGAAEGHIEVSVDVNTARKEQQAGGINDAIGIDCRDGLGDVFDGLVFDQEIGFIGAL